MNSASATAGRYHALVPESHRSHDLRIYRFRLSPESVSGGENGRLTVYCEDCEIVTELPRTWVMPSCDDLLLKGGQGYSLDPVGYPSP